MKINFKKPKYLIPVFFIPFIFLFYYLFGRPSENTQKKIAQSNQVKQQGVQAAMPGVDTTISNSSVKDKFDTYQKKFKEARDFSAIGNLKGDESNTGRQRYSYNSAYSDKDLKKLRHQQKMDSLNKVLAKGQSNLKKALNSYYQSTNSEGNDRIGSSQDLENENTDRNKAILQSLNRMNQPSNTRGEQDIARENLDENEDMANFKKRMLFMDSLRKSLMNGEQASSGKEIKHKKFDPSKDSSFRPLHVATSLSKNTGYFNTVTNVHEDENAISAMIDQNVKVHLGSRVRIRLLKDIFVGNHKIEKGSYLYGMVSGFQTQRVNISITQIQYHNTSLPVKLDVYDNDGYLGLYVPGSNFREFTKEIGTQATRGMSQVISPDGSDIKANLLSQVFNTTTTTMAKLIKKDKAFLKYDYIVYLKERNSESN